MYRGPVVITELTSGVIDPITTRRYRIFGTNQVASHEIGLVVVGFQGAGVIGDCFVSNLETAKSAIQKFSDINDVVSLMKDATGSFTLQIIDAITGTLYFLNDPLGGGLIIRCRIGRNGTPILANWYRRLPATGYCHSGLLVPTSDLSIVLGPACEDPERYY